MQKTGRHHVLICQQTWQQSATILQCQQLGMDEVFKSEREREKTFCSKLTHLFQIHLLCLVRWEAERTGSCWYWSRHVHVLCERHHLKDVSQRVHMALQEKAPQLCAGCCLLSASRSQLPLFSLITVLLSSPQRRTVRVQQQQQRLNTVYCHQR